VGLRGIPFTPLPEIAHERQRIVERTCFVHAFAGSSDAFFLKAPGAGRILPGT